VAHLLDHDHRRLLVQLLVDGDHLAQLHQLLDDLAGLDRHLVRQVGHADGLGHVHFLDRPARWAPKLLGSAVVAIAAAAAARRTPAGAAAGRVAARLQAARFLAASSAQLDDSFSLLTASCRPAWPPGRQPVAAPGGLGLVDGALDGFLGRLGRLGLLGLLGHQHLLAAAFIMARMAAASASAALRRRSRSSALACPRPPCRPP
jgi:hypothetical protein